MKIAVPVLLVVLIAGGLGLWMALGQPSVGIYTSTCQQDLGMDSDARAAIEKKAADYVRASVNGDTTAAFAMLSREGQAATPLQKMSAMLQRGKMKLHQRIQITRTSLFKSAGSGRATRAVCGALNGTDWIAADVEPGTTQAYVEATASSNSDEIVFVLVLVDDGADWKVQSAYFGSSDMGGKDADALLRLARQERDNGSLFYARILYQAVRIVTDRGSHLQLGLSQTVEMEIADLKVAPEFSGKPPFAWSINGKTYSVSDVTPYGFAGKQLGIIFVLPQTVWRGEAEADKSNREFLNAFVAAHPDHARLFEVLVARALKPDQSGGFGTVYQAGVGFQ